MRGEKYESIPGDHESFT